MHVLFIKDQKTNTGPHEARSISGGVVFDNPPTNLSLSPQDLTIYIYKGGLHVCPVKVHYCIIGYGLEIQKYRNTEILKGTLQSK